MASVKRWVDVNVPPPVAEREWRDVTFRSMIGGYTMAAEAVRWSESDDAQTDGTVSYRGLPSGPTRVTLEVEYDPGAGEAAREAVDRLVRSRLFTFRATVDDRYGAVATTLETIAPAVDERLPKAA